MRIKCLNIYVNNAWVRLQGHSAAGGDWQYVCVCVCWIIKPVQSNALGLKLRDSYGGTLRWVWRFFSSICSQIDLDIYIVRFDCNITNGREWGLGREGGTVEQWLLLFNQLKLWTRVTQSQATSCPICLATGRAHVPHLNISQARLPKQSRHEEGEKERQIERGKERGREIDDRQCSAHSELTQLEVASCLLQHLFAHCRHF